MFFQSMSEPEQRHIVSALAFELGKVETVAIRKRMLGHLANINKALVDQVERALAMEGQADKITPVVAVRSLKPSPSLSLIKKAVPTLKGRKIGVLISDGFDEGLLTSIYAAAKTEKAAVAVVAPQIGGAKNKAGKMVAADMALSAAPSVLFDAVVVLAGDQSGVVLAKEAAAVDWIRDAFGHLKTIGFTEAAQPVIDRADIAEDEAVINIMGNASIKSFITAAKAGKLWKREPTLRSPG
jgi:catalase